MAIPSRIILGLIALAAPTLGLAADSPYPFRTGTRWVYETTTGVERTVLVEGLSEAKLGETMVPIAVIRRSDGSDRVVLRTTKRWIECGTLDLTTRSVQCDEPIIFFQWPLSTGLEWNSAGLEFEVIGQETTAVPAGSYEGAWKIRYTPRGSERAMGELWVAPGVGRVRVREQEAEHSLVSFSLGTGPDLAAAPEETVDAFLKGTSARPISSAAPSSKHLFWRGEFAKQGLVLFGLPLVVLAALFGLGLTLLKTLREGSRDAPIRSQVSTKEQLDLIAALAAAGDVTNALERLSSMVSANPSYADLRHHLAQLLKVDGRFDEAIVQWKEAIKLNPKYTDAILALANLLLHVEQYDEAKVHFSSVLERQPEYADALVGLGQTLLHLGDRAGARIELEKALRVNGQLKVAQELLLECQS